MRFISLKSINGDPLLVNLSAVRTVSSLDLAGVEMGVIGFDKAHEVVVGSTVAQVLTAMSAAPITLGQD